MSQSRHRNYRGRTLITNNAMKGVETDMKFFCRCTVNPPSHIRAHNMTKSKRLITKTNLSLNYQIPKRKPLMLTTNIQNI
jgi:hypothetical protein